MKELINPFMHNIEKWPILKYLKILRSSNKYFGIFLLTSMLSRAVKY